MKTKIELTIVICTDTQNKGKQGIHLRDPDEWYLNDAVQTAIKDMFETIYIHASLSGLMYKLHADTLAGLFNLQKKKNVQVVVVHPAASAD